MKNYELTYLISPEISEEKVQLLIAKMNDAIRADNGTVSNTSGPSKIKLGYSIEKKTEAFLVSTHFSSDPDKIINLERALKEEKEFLRHVIIVKRTFKEKPARLRKSIKPSAPETEAEKVELREIDQKIEEILQ